MKTRLLLIIGIIFLLSSSAQAESDYSYQPPLVPAPPQSAIVNTQNIQSAMEDKDINTEVIHYISAKPAKEIIRFYKRSLKTAGWQVASEFNRGPQSLISLTKDDIAANITVQNTGADESDVYVSVSQSAPEKKAAVSADPVWAPRYPGSIKRMYSEDKHSGAATAVYATDDSVEQIVKFYFERMPNNGWHLKDKVDLEKIPGFGTGNYQNLVFEGWQGKCLVSVNRPRDLSKIAPEAKNTTSILLNFTPER